MENKDQIEDTQSDEIEIEVVDDTPAEDRGRVPSPPPEEVSDDELHQYSESVQKRIKHFTKGYHDERRAKEAALREREEAIRLAQAVLEENKKLKGNLGVSQNVLAEQSKKVAQSELEQAKKRLKEAHESFDTDAIIEAQEALTVAKMKAERAENFKPAPLQQEENEVKIPQPAPQVQPDRKAADWQKQNPWFGSDDEMTAFALGLHQKLVKSGVSPQSDEYYEKINSRMRQVFPEQFGDETVEQTAPKPKASVVAPATRSTAPKKIVLTASEQAVAKRLGVPLEEYAKQVALLRKTNG